MLLTVGVWTLGGCQAHRPNDSEWGQTISLSGVRGLHKVSDELYRGGQPTREGFGQLRQLGIKTVINLRTVHRDQQEIQGSGLDLVDIPMSAWSRDIDEPVLKFLQIMRDPSRTPVYVHCIFGGDRTGAMTAAYRVVIQGWSKDKAMHEMTDTTFDFHSFWANMTNYIEDMDANAMRARLGLPTDAGYVYHYRPVRPYRPENWFWGGVKWGADKLFPPKDGRKEVGP